MHISEYRFLSESYVREKGEVKTPENIKLKMMAIPEPERTS